MISALLGLIYAASGVTSPVMLAALFDMISDSAAPVALFALGATVYGKPLKNALGELAAISMARLIIHPVLVAVLFLLLPGVDPPLDQGGAALGLPAGGSECVRAVGPLWRL